MARRIKPKKRIEIPRAFDLANDRWRVRMVTLRTLMLRNDEPGVKIDGLCSFKRLTIYINKALPREQIEETWLHELEHAIEGARGMANAGAEHVVTPRAKLRAQAYHSFVGNH
jgi:Zn-dependent peptidase ImmA (M78 family)